MKRRTRIGAAVVVLVLGACLGPLTPDWLLTDFRILGIKATPPEVPPGATSQLRLVYADISRADAGPRGVQVLWVACGSAISATSGLDAGVDGGLLGGFGGSSGCTPINIPGTVIPDLSPNVSLQVPVTGGTYDSSGDQVMNIVGFACAGGQIGAPVDGGTQPSCTSPNMPATGWEFTGELHIHANPLNPPNNNPQITEVRFGPMTGASTDISSLCPSLGVTLDGGTFPVIHVCTDTSRNSSCPKWKFEVGFSGTMYNPANDTYVSGPGSTSREMYISVNPLDGGQMTLTEQLQTNFIVDQGTLSGGSESDNDLTAMSTMEDDWFAPATPGDVHLYVYTIDARGGFDSTECVIPVVP